MIKVTADYNNKSAEVGISGRTDTLIYEFAMIVRSISNGLINCQNKSIGQNAMREFLTNIATDAINGKIMTDVTEVRIHVGYD